MDPKNLESILNAAKAPVNHPLFYPRTFALIAKALKSGRNSDPHPLNGILEDYEELSRRAERSQIQEGCSIRMILRCREIARILVDDKGEISFTLLPGLIQLIKEHLYSLGPNRQEDGLRQEHLLAVLNELQGNEKIAQFFKKLSRPYANRLAERLIIQTMQVSSQTPVTDALTKQAVLCAWMCMLRQNVGSCFATAPAEIIQSEQPLPFLQDLRDLIETGYLKRTYEGNEYTVPMSESWGNGDLNRPLQVKITSQGILPEIWCAPGLINALEKIGLVDPSETIKTKNQLVRDWILPFLREVCQKRKGCTTVEEIIRYILRQTLDLTEKQVAEWEMRRSETVFSQLHLNLAIKSKKLESVREKSAIFSAYLNQAKEAFASMTENPLLKSWEYTLASFSETKLEFTSWNLYASLGMRTDEPGGIGQCIQRSIQEKLDQLNREIKEIQYDQEVIYTQIKTLESRLRHISSDQELQYSRMDYQHRRHEYHALEEQKEHLQKQAYALVNLYELLYESYLELFKEYFQEIYDPDMREVESGPFDDSPAGFRLLYKHGRRNPSQWTLIKNLPQFIEMLAAFFVATENQISHKLNNQALEKHLSNTVTTIINHIKTVEFQETAFDRMALAHQMPPVKDPLNHLNKIKKKPWAYTSGGTMGTLINCYYNLGSKPKEESKWVENEMELLVFLADTLKRMPGYLVEPFIHNQRQSLLMHSPTHAFLLKPNLASFKKCWNNEEFTYTSIRDQFVQPAEIFVRQQLLNDEMIGHLISLFQETIHENLRPRFHLLLRGLKGPLTPLFFRESILEILEKDKSFDLIPLSEELDSLLYKSIPLFSLEELGERVRNILRHLPGFESKEINNLIEILEQIPLMRSQRVMTAADLREVCKALICLIRLSTTAAYDYHYHIAQAAQELGYAMPAPVIFGDTNWIKDYFGFVVNPGTGKLELWRLDYAGTNGFPMNTWKHWLNGTVKKPDWGIYNKPSEYGQN